MGVITQNNFTLKVKVGCSQQKIENFGNDRYLVKVTSTTHDKINLELKEMFSHYFGVPAPRIQIVSGIDKNDKKIRIDK